MNINEIDDKTLYVELVALPEIGDKTAKDIVEYRKKHIPLKIVNLSEIKGIGDKRLDQIKRKFKE